MSDSGDHPLTSDSKGRRPWSVAAVVLLWVIGVPAITLLCGIAGLAVGFSPEGNDPTGAVLIVGVVGLVVLVGLSAIILGGLDDDAPMSPPAPYAGTPLSEIPPVSSRYPLKRHVATTSGDDRSGPSPGT